MVVNLVWIIRFRSQGDNLVEQLCPRVDWLLWSVMTAEADAKGRLYHTGGPSLLRFSVLPNTYGRRRELYHPIAISGDAARSGLWLGSFCAGREDRHPLVPCRRSSRPRWLAREHPWRCNHPLRLPQRHRTLCPRCSCRRRRWAKVCEYISYELITTLPKARAGTDVPSLNVQRHSRRRGSKFHVARADLRPCCRGTRHYW